MKHLFSTKLPLFASVFLSFWCSSQVLLDYPAKQDFYKEGLNSFYGELRLIVSKKQNNCNKNEAISAKVMIDEDGKVKLVSETDSIALLNNKCGYELLKSSLIEMKNWIPAEVNGKKTNAITRFLFVPEEFSTFTRFPKNEKFLIVNYPGGIGKFRETFSNCIDLRKFKSDYILMYKFDFEVNTQGEIQNVFIDSYKNDKNIDYILLDCLFSKKMKKWSPGTYNGTPIISRITVPITISFK